jgi:asparagine synthase (glutamine-hydrolysing)
MTATLQHRGPDAEDVWTNDRAGIAFGHRRLSILDLTDAGAQPMHSECGRFTVTFNGEIYNHLDIRKELEAIGGAPNWRGHSDTETLLYAIRHWGIADAINRFVGMFAVAVWDEAEQELTLCRDRFGEKPLFYGWSGRDLVFASELKALAAHPDWSPSLDRPALTSFMRYCYVPAPQTIWRDVRKLPSGSLVTFAANAPVRALPQPVQYWSHRDCIVAGQGRRIESEADAADEFERLLSRAISRQCLSDVPLGAFLSGGVDSSTVVALMQKQSSRPIRTFTIGFSEGGFDEAGEASDVARHLGTSHTELYVDAKTAMDVIPNLSRMYDEPFADSSQIPTHLVASLARQHVTVALTGDAGDELFGGYNRHVWGTALNARLSGLPRPVRSVLGAALAAVAPEPANTIVQLLEPVLPKSLRTRRAGDQVAKIARIVDAKSADDLYRLLCSIDSTPSDSVIGGQETASWADSEMNAIATRLDPLDRMTLADSLSYLSDDILQKVDRAAMSVSLETRVPFLDRDVVDFASRVPPSMKIRDGRGKWLVRQVLYKHVPAALIDRPKTGFSIPLDQWLRGPLKSWAHDLLAPARLRQQGLFNVKRVELMLHQHMSGRRNHGYWLWNVLMAQAWHDEWCAS